MASTNSSVGITINIVCKEVQYDFSDFPDYDFIRQAAISAVQKEYAERQREEDEEIEDMLNALNENEKVIKLPDKAANK